MARADKASREVRTRQAGLAHAIASRIGDAEKQATAIPGLSLHRWTAPTPPCPGSYQPSVAVLAQGKKRVDLGRTSFVYDQSRFLLAAVDLPVIGRVVEATEAAPCLALLLKLDMPMVRELLQREQLQLPPVPSGTPAMATGELTPALLDAFRRLLDLLATPQDLPTLEGLVQREIVYRLLRSTAGARLRSIATAGDQSHRTARAIAWIKENYSKPLRVEHLAALANMGVSTLHHHFRALTAMSPLQYQKQLRLQAARGRMLVDGLDAAGAAFEVGYESPTQFSREYSRFFGRPPMRDVEALRTAGATAPTLQA